MEKPKLREDAEFRPKVLTYVGKVMTVGGNLCTIIPKKVVEVIDIRYLDLIQVTVRNTGTMQPVSGNRGKHILLRKNEKKENNKSE